jgi:flagellar basal-body rod modification protein FlgD
MIANASLINNITAPKQNKSAFDLIDKKDDVNKSAFDLTAKKADTNFEDFLFLFTTQLKNQLPDDNVDSSQMLAQLAQFTSVEQQIKGNQLLEKMLSFQEDNKMDKATSYLGKIVEINNSSADFDHKPINFSYEIPKTNPSTDQEFTPYYTSITILDDKNQIIYSAKGEISAQKHNFSWDGELNGSGLKAKKGHYHLKVETEDRFGVKIPIATNYKGVVTKVISNGDKPLIIVGDKNQVDMSKIMSVSEPKSDIKDTRNYSDPMDYLGKLVKADFSKVTLDKAKSLIHYYLEQDADISKFSVTDKSNKFVGTFLGKTSDKGINSIVWDGKLSNGTQLKDGPYNLYLSATGLQNKPVKNNLSFGGMVVSFQDGERVIFSVDGLDVPQENIVAIGLATTEENVSTTTPPPEEVRATSNPTSIAPEFSFMNKVFSEARDSNYGINQEVASAALNIIA